MDTKHDKVVTKSEGLQPIKLYHPLNMLSHGKINRLYIHLQWTYDHQTKQGGECY